MAENNLFPEISYNEAIAELESIIKEMQSENCDIDKLAQNTRRAAELIDLCQKKLTRTETEIQRILATLDSPKD